MRFVRWAVVLCAALVFSAGSATTETRGGAQVLKARAHAVKPAPATPAPRPYEEGSIAGTVTDAAGVPLAGITIIAINAETGETAWGEAVTDESGAFTLGPLPTAPYVVLTKRSTGFIDELFDDVPCPNLACDLADGDVVWPVGETASGVRFELERGEAFTGTISGSDTGAGLPARSAWVEIYDGAGEWMADSYPTDDSGAYASPALPDGQYFIRTRNQIGYLNKAWENVDCNPCDVTATVPVTLGTPGDVAAPSYSFTLSPGGRIAGTITVDGAGLSRGQAGVDVYSNTGEWVTRGELGGDGYYLTLDGLPTGNHFVVTTNPSGWPNELYDNLACNNCNPTVGTPVAVVTGETTSGIDFDLEGEAAPAFDLRVSLTAPPAAGPGTVITVSDVTKNMGPDPAPPSTTVYYLSTDDVFDDADFPLGSRDVTELAAGESVSGDATLVIPGDTVPGEYVLFARADGYDALMETDDTNNVSNPRPIRIGFDFVLGGFWAPHIAAPGTPFTVNELTKNAGPGPAPVSRTIFRLSTDATADAGDTVLAVRVVPELAPGTVSSGSTEVTIPAGTPPGTYYLIAKADGDDSFAETSETNNAQSRQVKIGFDLAMVWMHVPSGAAPGAVLTVTSATKNLGPGAAPASTTGFYLSTDTSWDPADPLVGTRGVEALAPWTVSAGAATVTLPDTLVSGTYYIIAKADGPDLLPETVEANNTHVKAIRVGFDLFVGGFWAPSGIAPGGTVLVLEQTKNAGPGAAPPSVTAFFLSADSVWDAGDLRLGQRAVGELHPWQRSGAATPVVIPADTVPGAYFLIAAADGDAALAESSESNNAQARPVRIGFDLTVHALHAPGWATGGASIQIGDSTKNLGPGASPATTTTFYLSADPVADAGDVVLGERAIEPLPAWGRSAMVTTVTIPAGTAPGTYFLLAVVDAAGLVPELSEANNTRYRGIVIK